MIEPLSGKTALVVGAGRGLGRQAAEVLAQAGARIIAVSRTNSDLQLLLKELPRSAEHCAIAMDLAADGAPSQLLKDIADTEIDIVLHNLGGTLGVREPLCAASDVRKVMRLNLDIAVDLNAGLVPLMRKRGWGRVVHVSSVAAATLRSSMAYAVAKSALNTYTQYLGRVVAADGVVVSAIMPSAIIHDGSHWDDVSRNRPEDAELYLRERVASHKFATPQQVARFILYLCSDPSPLFAGAVVPLDGGGM